MGTPSNRAIILSECGIIKATLLYEEVHTIRKLITNFLLIHITEKHQCLGLKMPHNIYIPSIILSLQELQHTFIFLPVEEATSDTIIEELGISWVLSFDTTKESEIVLPLTDQNLILEQKSSHTKIKHYKNVFYIVRTSGTTGENKFVRVGQHSIESNIKSLTKIFNIASDDIIYFGTPLTFDPCMIELLLALENGACLLITTTQIQINSYRLYETLFDVQNGITILQIVPSLFERWSQEQISNIMSNSKLRVLAFGGEPFPRFLLDYKKKSNLRIFNLYGITEVSCWASVHEVSEESNDDIPVGDPLDDTIIEVRDNCGNKITSGEGELYIGSKDRICWVNNEVDEPANIVFRATGDLVIINNNQRIVYKGRKHDVFKRFGHKLHLSKIEEMVQKETNLQNKCVWSKSKCKLLLFLIIDDFERKIKDKMLDKIRIKLLHTLPKQYFPDHIDIIRKCPVTAHGKTDKKTLESIYLSRNRSDSLRTVDIFKAQLCKYFGFNEKHLSGDLRKATFFEIGGNSILAIQFLGEFEDEINAKCPDLAEALFEKDLETCLKCAHSTIGRKRPNSSEAKTNTCSKKVRSDREFRILWTYNLEACVDSSPLVFEHSGKILAAVGSFSHIFAILDARNGEEIAKYTLPDVIEAPPCLSPCRNFLYVGCFDGKLYSLDFTINKIGWTYSTNDRIKCRPILCRQSKAVVFGSYDKYVHCVDIQNGLPIWKTHVAESIVSTPILEQCKIYIASICGTCLCLSETNGSILWQYKSGSPIFGSPCHLDGLISWPTVHGNIICLDSSGSKVWEFECGGHLYSSLVPYKKLIVFGCHDQNLYILEVQNNVPKAKVLINLEDTLTTPGVWEDLIIVTGNSGRLVLMNFEGGLLDDLKLPAHVFSSVIVYDGKVFVGCRDNNLYCIGIVNKT